MPRRVLGPLPGISLRDAVDVQWLHQWVPTTPPIWFRSRGSPPLRTPHVTCEGRPPFVCGVRFSGCCHTGCTNDASYGYTKDLLRDPGRRWRPLFRTDFANSPREATISRVYLSPTLGADRAWDGRAGHPPSVRRGTPLTRYGPQKSTFRLSLTDREV